MDVVFKGSLDLGNGVTAYFQKKVGRHSITSGGAIAINLYTIDSDCPWVIERNADRCVASPGIPSENRLELTVQVGDSITIEARQKGEVKVSRKGNGYITLTHVKYPTI